MRVLWVTAEPPDQRGGGGNIRQAHLLSAVAAAHPTDLLLGGELRDDDVRARLASVVEVPVSARKPPASTLSRRLLDLRLIGPTGPPEHYDGRPARQALRSRLRDDYDVVVVQHAALAHLLPRRRRSRWVAELHNVGSETLAALSGVAVGRRQRWLTQRQAARARRLERWITAHYDAVVTVSDEDAAALPGPSHVLPNGVDVSAWTVTPLPTEPRVVFVATLDYLPNVDGVHWFCEQVWPAVRAALPAATLDIVGRNPTGGVRALEGAAGVTVHGDVPEVASYVRNARAAVVPLRIGSGSRLKALEAWAAARPVVGTTTGLAGLGVVDGTDALVRDDAADFAAAVVEVLQSDALAQSLATAGRRRAEDDYDWRIIGRDYAAWLATV